ncbi:MAG: LysM peptidoglycan-binding domain-containing protein [Actinomycetota bacterium]|nr:LysM peptidoglycan-binding domain-containing protein [Actinomycetota bacterium]
MPHRSPARFLAPLALLAAVVTIYLVARPEVDGAPKSSSSTTASKTAPSKTGSSSRTASRGTTTPKKAARTYTVKPGDVLGSISETTGVPLADLREYNDLEDAQSLSVGQKLKLAP